MANRGKCFTPEEIKILEANGLPEIVPEQAETVRLIYRMFMEGKSPSYIARYLTGQGILSPAGKNQWRPETVKSILSNEKYKGDALLQKTFRTDFLTKKTKINEGEVPQYYVDHSHPAIIDPALYDAVQIEMKARVRPGRRNYTPHFFSGRIYCAECSGLYGSNTCRHQTVWRCNNRHRKTTDCQTPALRNQTIEDAFVMAFNQIIEQKDSIMATCLSIMTERCDTTTIEKEITHLRAELAIVAEAMTEQINMNARVAIEQNGYKQQFRELETQSKDIQEKINALEQQRITLQAKLNAIRVYIDTLRSQNRITGFNETLWLNTVERLWIGKGGIMKFEFKGGQCVEG